MGKYPSPVSTQTGNSTTPLRSNLLGADPELVSYFSGLSLPELNREMEMAMLQLQGDSDVQSFFEVVRSHPELAQATRMGNHGRLIRLVNIQIYHHYHLMFYVK